MSVSQELERNAGFSFKPDSTLSPETNWFNYEEVNLRAQGDIALIKKGGEPFLALSFKTVDHPNPEVSSRGRRLFIAAPLKESIMLQKGEVNTWMGYITASGTVGEASVIFNESHALYKIGDSIRLHYLGKDQHGATVGIESTRQLTAEFKPGNLNSKELLRIARIVPQRKT